MAASMEKPRIASRITLSETYRANARHTPRTVTTGNLPSCSSIAERLSNTRRTTARGAAKRPHTDQIWPSQATFWPRWAKAGQKLTQVGRSGPNPGRCWAFVVNFGQCVDQCRSMRAESWPVWAKSNPIRATLGKCWPDLAEIWPRAAKFGRSVCRFGVEPLLPIICSRLVGQLFGNFETTSALAGVAGGDLVSGLRQRYTPRAPDTFPFADRRWR